MKVETNTTITLEKKEAQAMKDVCKIIKDIKKIGFEKSPFTDEQIEVINKLHDSL